MSGKALAAGPKRPRRPRSDAAQSSWAVAIEGGPVGISALPVESVTGVSCSWFPVILGSYPPPGSACNYYFWVAGIWLMIAAGVGSSPLLMRVACAVLLLSAVAGFVVAASIQVFHPHLVGVLILRPAGLAVVAFGAGWWLAHRKRRDTRNGVQSAGESES